MTEFPRKTCGTNNQNTTNTYSLLNFKNEETIRLTDQRGEVAQLSINIGQRGPNRFQERFPQIFRLFVNELVCVQVAVFQDLLGDIVFSNVVQEGLEGSERDASAAGGSFGHLWGWGEVGGEMGGEVGGDDAT